MTLLFAALAALSAVFGWAAFACSIGASLWAIAPERGTLLGLVLGLCVGIALSRNGLGQKAKPQPLVLGLAGALGLSLVGSSLWLPAFDQGLGQLEASLGLAGVAKMVSIALGAGLGYFLTRSPQLLIILPSRQQAAFAALLSPVVLSVLLPRMGEFGLGCLALTGLICNFFLVRKTGVRKPTDFRERSSTPGRQQAIGAPQTFAAGIALGWSFPLLWSLITPLVGPSLDTALLGFTTLTLASLAGENLAGRFAPGVLLRIALLAIALLLSLFFCLWLPETLVMLNGKEPFSSLDGTLLLQGLGLLVPTLLGLGLGFAGRPSATGLGCGLLGFTLGPAGFGSLQSAAALGGLGGLWALGGGLINSQRKAATLGLLGASFGLAVLWLQPQPSALWAAAPYRLAGQTAPLRELVRRLNHKEAKSRGHASGSTILSHGLFPDRLWASGSTQLLDTASWSSDVLFGHLPALLGAQGRHVLVHGMRTGAVADAARRSSKGLVVGWPTTKALRPWIRDRGDWNRDLGADPSFRIANIDPLFFDTGPRFDAILVDLPAITSRGAKALWSPRRWLKAQEQLTEQGWLVIRVPLRGLDSDTLASLPGALLRSFTQVSAWLDPSGAEHLLLAAGSGKDRVLAQSIYDSSGRPSLRDDLRAAALLGPEDVLERLVASSPGLRTIAADRPTPGFWKAALEAGRRIRRSEAQVPLSVLASASGDAVDFDGLSAEDRSKLGARLTSASRVRGTYLQMLGHWGQGQAQEALSLAKRLSHESSSPTRDLKAIIQPWMRRGEALEAQGQLAAAEAEFLMAASFSPRDPEANLKLADVLRQRDRLTEAEQRYAIVLEEDRGSIQAQLGLSDVMVRQGKIADAVDALEDAEKSHAGSYPLLVNLGFLHMQLARGDETNIGQRLARSRVLFQRAAALEPGRPEARAGAAEVYFRQGEFERAREEIDRALLLADSCHYRSWRGHILYELNRKEEAENDVRTALMTCPDLLDARVLLGNCAADAGRYQQAREAWEGVLSRDGSNQPARFNLEQLEESQVEELKRKPGAL